MANPILIHPSISALIDLSIQRISSDEVQKFTSKNAKTSFLLDQMKHKMLSFKEFLSNLDHKASSSDDQDHVRHWLDDLKDVVYDAENTLDEIAIKALRSNSSSNTSFKKVHLSIFSCMIPFDERLDSEVMNVLKRLDGFIEQASALGLQDSDNKRHVSETSGFVGSGLMPSSRKCVGRDLEMKALIDIMDSRKSEMVLISGVSGVGKTAIAKLVYNDERFDGVFDVKAWVPFQRDFDLLEAFKGLYETMLEPLWSSDMESIEKKLCGFIRGKKLLIVFDDVCFERFGSLEELLRPIRVAAKGTIVIFTSCDDNASSVMHPSPDYHLHLKPLSDNDCCSIIKSIALDSNSEAIGRRLATKCEGLPLSAVMLGGVNEVYDNISALRLSYESLYNPELKLCFAYCSLFPKNYKFQRRKLVLLWMAEGFLQDSNEELGNAYFNELVARSFFREMDGNEPYFVMHNLIHDLAVSIFTAEFETTRRHFSYVQTKYHDSGKFEALSNVKLRTFLALTSISNGYFCYIPRMVIPVVFPKHSCLRVLSLSHYLITELPSSVENLRHLRYLDLSYTRIITLPNTIRKLYKLQSLLLSNCGRLSSLPAELGSMISLRHLDISNTDSLQEMPYLISRLRNLQTLTKFALSSDMGAKISEMNQLQGLKGTLLISGLENVDSLASSKAANIKGKVFLDEIVYQWEDYSTQQDRVLDDLKPHVDLKRLTIHGFCGMKFPKWIGDLEYHNMEVVNLIDCSCCVSLPPLGQLPSLKHLTIEGLRKVLEVGSEFYGSFFPFPSLETLKFKNMGSWRKWHSFRDQGIAFPKLKELCLDFCPALSDQFPDNLPLLRKLDIRHFPELTNSLRKLGSIRSLTLSRCSLQDLHIVGDLTSLSSLKIDTPNKSTWPTFQASNLSDITENLEVKSCSFESFCYAPTWLRSLTLSRCRNLGLTTTECYTSLRYLSINGVDSLTEFHLNLFPNLVYLDIASCHNLQSFDTPSTTLRNLSISDCQNPLNLSFNDLVSLNVMSIVNCPEIDTFSSNGFPPNLISVTISSCNKLISNRKNWGIHNLGSLKVLEIGGNGYMERLESFPDDELLLPTSLVSLSINGFKNLKSLNIRSLRSLEELKISWCPKLEGFTEDALPHSLCCLDVSCSRKLELRCLPNKEDWPQISRVPRVRVASCEF